MIYQARTARRQRHGPPVSDVSCAWPCGNRGRKSVISPRSSVARHATQCDPLEVCGARKIVRGLKEALTENERQAVADHVVAQRQRARRPVEAVASTARSGLFCSRTYVSCR
jgi:hypothetical protein